LHFGQAVVGPIAELQLGDHNGGMDIERIRANVAVLRVLFRMEQKVLAGHAHVNPSYISRLEAGITKRPRLEELSRVASVFGLGVDDLSKEVECVVRKARLTLPKPVQSQPIDADDGSYVFEGSDVIRYVRPPMAAAADPHRGVDMREVAPDHFFVEVIGDCLEPEVKSGDWLVMSETRTPQVGKVVLVEVFGELHLKKIVSNNGRMVLGSQRGILVLPREGARYLGVEVKRLREPEEI
jgi:transcriptional regulator with XRE-family HTH domain